MYDRDRVIDGSGNIVTTKEKSTGPSAEERKSFLNMSVAKILDDDAMGKLMKEGAIEALNMTDEEYLDYPVVCALLGRGDRIVEEVPLAPSSSVTVSENTASGSDLTLATLLESKKKLDAQIASLSDGTISEITPGGLPVVEGPRRDVSHLMDKPISSNQGISQEDMDDRNNRVNKKVADVADAPGTITSTMPDSSIKDKYEPVDDI